MYRLNTYQFSTYRLPWLVPLVALAVLAAPIQSASAIEAFIGQEVVLGRYHEIRYDPATRQCMALRAPALVVVKRPERGTVSVQRSEEVIAHPRCPGLRGPVVTLVYRANGQEPGNDEVSWNVIHQSAQLGNQPYQVRIEVRRGAPGHTNAAAAPAR